MNDLLDFVDQAAEPSSLFMALWTVAEGWTPSARASATRPGAMFISGLEGALISNSGAEVRDSLRQILNIPAGDDASRRGQILETMRAIDRAFYAIHPRIVTLAPSTGLTCNMPGWLREARESRQLFGVYQEDQDRRLIARGPLCRASRQPTAANADTLADRFTALEVVPRWLTQDGRKISVSHKIVPVDVARGIVPVHHAGRETVAFLPVAHDAADMVKTEVQRGGQKFVDFRVAEQLDAPERIISGLVGAGVIDIAIAGELTVCEDDADTLAQRLLHHEAGPRILVAGSGATRAKKDEQPWNETRIVNGIGSELWRQQKLWPAGITQALAKYYGLSDPGEEQILEDTASGDEVVVVDADGLGRCIVLICQDLQARPLTDDLLRHFQPDWVFIPVMDSGVDIGRWSHRRAFELSVLSQSRFLIASSLTLARWLKAEPLPPCGLAVGPAVPADREVEGDADGERAVAVARVAPSMEPGCALLTWREGTWRKTTVGAE